MGVGEINDKVTLIYNNTYNTVSKYIVSKCRRIDDVPDILQNVYMKLYSRLLKKDDIQEPIKYLMRIARHEVYKYYGIWALDMKSIPVFSQQDEEDFSK